MFFQVDERVTPGLIPAALAGLMEPLLDPHNETCFTFVTSPVEGMATWDLHTALLPFFPSFILTGGNLRSVRRPRLRVRHHKHAAQEQIGP